MTTVGRIFVVKCDQSVNLCANFASDASPNRIIWWYTSAPTKAPKSHSPARFAESTLSVKTTYVSTGKYHSRFFFIIIHNIFVSLVVSQLITTSCASVTVMRLWTLMKTTENPPRYRENAEIPRKPKVFSTIVKAIITFESIFTKHKHV